MLTVINDLFTAADAGDCAFVIPVNISVACDTEGLWLSSKHPSESRLVSQMLISHVSDHIFMLDNFLPLYGRCSTQHISFVVLWFQIKYLFDLANICPSPFKIDLFIS